MSVAVLVFVLTMVLTVAIKGHVTLNKQAKQVENIFYNGERNDGLSIHKDLKELGNAAKTIISIAEKELDLSTPELVNVKKGVEELSKATNPQQYYQAYQLIDGSMEPLIAQLEAKVTDETQVKILTNNTAEYRSRVKTIGYSVYNAEVRNYKETIGHFPANMIALFTNVKKVYAFE